MRELSAEQALARAREAAKRAGAVQIEGPFAQGGQEGRIDVRVQDSEGEGTLQVQDLELDLVRADDALFIRGDRSFYRQFGGAQAAKALDGKWLRGSPDEPQLRAAADFLSLDALIENLLTPEGTLEKAGEKTIDGQRALVLRDTEGRDSVAIALDGEPYPLELTTRTTGNDGGSGELSFSRWGERFEVQAPDPADVVDPSQLPAPSPS